jgi:hypothetical protein
MHNKYEVQGILPTINQKIHMEDAISNNKGKKNKI